VVFQHCLFVGVFCAVVCVGVLFVFLFQWKESLMWSFPFGFRNPLEGFPYGPTCVEEIALSKAVTAFSVRQVCGKW